MCGGHRTDAHPLRRMASTCPMPPTSCSHPTQRGSTAHPGASEEPAPPRLAPRRGAEPRPARRRRPPRRAAAGGRRSRIGQDAGAHPPHRPPRSATRACTRCGSSPSRSPTRPPTRCASAWRRSSGRCRERCGSARSTPPACESCGANADRLGYPQRSRIYDQADAQRLTGYVIRDLGARPEALPAARRPRRRSAGGRTICVGPDAGHRAGRATSSTARRRRLPRVPGAPPKAGAMDFDDLLATTVAPAARPPDVLEKYQERFSTSSSTSTRTRTRPERARRAARRRAPQRHRRRRQRPVGLPLPRRRLPQHHAVRGSLPRRHDRRARAELPQHADHPRRRQRRHRQQRRRASRRSCGPTQGSATGSSATTPRTRATRRRRSRARCTQLHDDRRPRWREMAVFYRTNAQSRVVEER